MMTKFRKKIVPELFWPEGNIPLLLSGHEKRDCLRQQSRKVLFANELLFRQEACGVFIQIDITAWMLLEDRCWVKIRDCIIAEAIPHCLCFAQIGNCADNMLGFHYLLHAHGNSFFVGTSSKDLNQPSP